MFFLLRMAFWLGLVLVLLPTGRIADSEKLPQIGAGEAVSAATAAVSDMSQFCTRQPTACDIGGQAATVIGHRAQSGARTVYEFFTDKTDKKEKSEKSDKADTGEKSDKGEKAVKADKPDKPAKTDRKNSGKSSDHTGSIGDGLVPPDASAAPASTLTPDDLSAGWTISGVETIPAPAGSETGSEFGQ